MNRLDHIKPLMSITGYNAFPVNSLLENSDMEVTIDYDNKKRFAGTVTAEEWNDFIKRCERCEEAFWNM